MKKVILRNNTALNFKKHHFGFILATAVLIMIIAGFMSINVYSQSMENMAIRDKHTADLLEREYINAMKHIMERYGCEYAGITMTKIYEAEYSAYEVVIHHSNLRYLDKEQIKELSADLENVTQDFPKAKFAFKLSM